MNSVLGIGENIIFIKNGYREWVGDMNEIYRTSNEALNEFVFATDLFQKVKDYVISNEHREKSIASAAIVSSVRDWSSASYFCSTS